MRTKTEILRAFHESECMKIAAVDAPILARLTPDTVYSVLAWVLGKNDGAAWRFGTSMGDEASLAKYRPEMETSEGSECFASR